MRLRSTIFFDHDVGVFPFDHGRIEVVRPEHDHATKVILKETEQDLRSTSRGNMTAREAFPLAC